MGFRHMSFFNLVEVMRQDGCPFCRIRVSAGRRYLTTTLYEFVNDPSVRQHVAAAHGFCREHARELRLLIDPLGVALLHETLLRHLLSASDSELFSAPRAPCPACRYASDAVESNIGTFLDNFAEPEIHSYLEESPAICFVHLQQIARSTRNKAITRTLADVIRRKAEDLYERVRRYAESENATLAQGSKPETHETIWLECLEFFSGSDSTFDGER